ncbi:hypothetical protein Q1695_006709 [Nippostrongylus brasiliensis]|nr:hypothetical protein Q1695_006709 [Nippostrongylus brasiliensis]
MVGKAGEKVELTLGSRVVNWKRVVGDREEFIKYCGPTENSPRCGQFVTADNIPSDTRAQVLEDGSLVIEGFSSKDVGMYSSPDLKMQEMELPNGARSAVAAPVINLDLETE